MRVFWQFSSDDGTFTASSTADGFDVADLQRSTLSPPWKSKALVVGETLTVNLGSAQQVTAFSLLGHNLVVGSDTVVLEAADDAAFAVGLVAISVTLTADNWFEYFPQQTKQYWRLSITKSASGNQVFAGRFLLGKNFTIPGLAPGYTLGPGADTSDSVTTKAGQTYGNLGVVSRRLRGSINALTNDDIDELREMQESVGRIFAFVVSIDFENKPVEKSIYGTLNSVAPFTNFAVTRWAWRLAMREQK